MNKIISTKTLVGHTGTVIPVFAINNIIISGSYDNSVKIWDIKSGQCINTLNGHTGSVRSVFAINNFIISGSWDMSIKIWDISSGECINTINGHTDSVWSVCAIGNKIISGSSDKTIKIHEFITHKQIFTALMCMWKLDYPTEIIHEIFSWLGINTYA
jgi:WD40 repeat protein